MYVCIYYVLFIDFSIGLFILWYFWTLKGISRAFQLYLTVFQDFKIIFRTALEIPLNTLEMPLKCPRNALETPLTVQEGHKIKRPMDKSMNNACWASKRRTEPRIGKNRTARRDECNGGNEDARKRSQIFATSGFRNVSWPTL